MILYVDHTIQFAEKSKSSIHHCDRLMSDDKNNIKFAGLSAAKTLRCKLKLSLPLQTGEIKENAIILTARKNSYYIIQIEMDIQRMS
jgi:hypothetical protein